MKSIKIFTFLLFYSFLSHAQESLSLTQAIEKALAQNFDIRIEKQNVQVTVNNNHIGQAGMLPSVSVNLTQNNNATKIENPASVLQGTTYSNSLQPTLNLNWTIFNGFSAQITKQRLENLQKDTEGNAKIIVENTIQNIIRAYYRATLETERLKVLAEVLKLSRERYDYLQFKKELGTAVSSEVLLEKSNYLRDSSFYVNQNLVIRDALRNLNLLMAEPEVNKNYSLSEKFDLTEKDYNLEELLQNVVAENVDLKRLFLTQEILKSDQKLREAAQFPTVTLNSFYSYNRNRQDLSDAKILTNPTATLGVNTATTTNYGANLTLNFTVFNGGQIKRAIQNSKVQQEIGYLRIERLKLSLKRDLSSAYDLYNVRKQLVKIALEYKKTAETNLQLAEERFKNGTINSFDYRILQNNFIDAAFDELEAIFNLIDANTTILRLSGGLVDQK
ncbi:MAG: TolC family protein [Bacteroidetes bacterium]|nr:MAG: TolC family protein [Bacteroidota bacterium]